jgi:crotonobetainyl-CoA:carnitine CoA-transferase CaiB-like acyl-CoA transferase
MRALQGAGIAAAVARTVGEVFDDPRLRARDFIQFLEHPEAGRYPHARAAFSLSKTPARTERHAPLFAEEGQAVLEEILREPARVR